MVILGILSLQRHSFNTLVEPGAFIYSLQELNFVF